MPYYTAFEHKHWDVETRGLITEWLPSDYREGNVYSSDTLDKGWFVSQADQTGLRFHHATQNSTQFMFCLFLGLSISYFEIMVSHRQLKPWNQNRGIREDQAISRAAWSSGFRGGNLWEQRSVLVGLGGPRITPQPMNCSQGVERLELTRQAWPRAGAPPGPLFPHPRQVTGPEARSDCHTPCVDRQLAMSLSSWAVTLVSPPPESPPSFKGFVLKNDFLSDSPRPCISHSLQLSIYFF